MEKGGYQIIDLKDFNITTTSVKIDGIYRAVSRSCRKVLLLSGLKINGVEMSDEFVKAVRVGTEFLLDAYCVVANNVLTKYDIFVEDDDTVTLQVKQVSSGGTPTPGQSNYTVSSETDDSYDSDFTGQEVDDAITKAKKALVTPVQAPTQQTLVGIGTANEQTQVLIGEGLELTGTTSPRTLRATGGGRTQLYAHSLFFYDDPSVPEEYRARFKVMIYTGDANAYTTLAEILPKLALYTIGEFGGGPVYKGCIPILSKTSNSFHAEGKGWTGSTTTEWGDLSVTITSSYTIEDTVTAL